MLSRLKSSDDELLEDLLAPPHLSEGIQALGFWHERRRRLPWYRSRARREAELMTVRWEQRVAAALLRPSGAPLGTRVSAGLLFAQSRMTRWGRRARIALVASVSVVIVLAAVPVIGLFAILSQAL